MKNIVFAILTFYGVSAQVSQIKLSAKIENRKSDTLYVGSGDLKKTIVANDQGIFNGSFSGHAGKYYFINGEDYVNIYLQEGFDLIITANSNDFKKTLSFSGMGAKENTLYQRKNKNSLDTEMDIADGIEDFEAFTASWTERLLQIREELKDKAFSTDYRSLMETDLGHDEHNFPTMSEYQFKRQGLENKPLPPFRFQDTMGNMLSNQDFEGKYIFMDIWATWCGPCHKEMPFLQQLEEKYKDENLVFLSISADRETDLAKWRKMVEEKALGGMQLISDKNFESDFMKALAVNFVPRFIIVSPSGIIIDADAEKPSDPALRQKLDKLLQ